MPSEPFGPLRSLFWWGMKYSETPMSELFTLAVLFQTWEVIREFHVGRAARCGYEVAGEVQADLVQRLVHAMRTI
jgi:hypothetical protein